jgi:hypothetical protein
MMSEVPERRKLWVTSLRSALQMKCGAMRIRRGRWVMVKRALARGAVGAHFFQNSGARVNYATMKSLLWTRNFA